MNSTNGSIYLTKNQWFEAFGSTLARDIMCLFIITPISLMGFILNVLSYIVLCKKKFKNILVYSFMRMYTINSLILNLLMFFLFIANSYRFFDFSYASSLPAYYLSYVFIPFTNICMYFAISIEIVISIERISQFIPSTRQNIIAKHKPRNIGIILLIGCLIINAQYFFNEQPVQLDLKLNSTSTFRFHFAELTSFSFGLFGTILNFFTYFLRDVLLLILQCILAIISIILIKRYFKNKKKMITNLPELYQNQTNTCSEATSTTTIQNMNKIQTNDSSASANKNKKITRADKNLTIMVLIITFLSIIEHLFFIVLVVALSFFMGTTAFLIVMSSDLFISFKHFLNFFLLYFFNKLFKIEMRKIFCKRA